LNDIPDYNNYLIYILTQMAGEPDTIRAMAGLYLKNNIVAYYDQFHPEVRNYIKECCLQSIMNPHPLVRNTTGTLMTTIITKGTLKDWPQLLPRFIQLLESSDYNTCDGVLSALHKICEDSADSMDNEDLGKPSRYIIPKCIMLLNSPYEKIRVYALTCLYPFIRRKSESLMAHMSTFIENLYHRASDPCAEVRKYVCQSLVALIEIWPEELMVQMAPVVEYMLYCSQDADPRVALEACEFWIAFAEQPSSYDMIRPLLPKLVPILLKNMVYTEEELATMRDIDEDASVPDRPEDVKPRFHKAKVHGFEHNEVFIKEKKEGDSKRVTFLDEEEEEEDEEDEDNIEYSEWNLRKSAAASLDMMASMFAEDLPPHMMTTLSQLLHSSKWEERESAILALGAVADGCLEGMESYLLEIISYVLANLRDSQVRSGYIL
jgi:hypothetical protein